MQCVYFLVFVASLAIAEQPSHSYLPPSPTSRNNGYSEGAPGVQGFQRAQVVAARTSVSGNSANGFARTSPSEYHASARAPSQSYDDSAPTLSRNSNESDSEPANYNFGYMVSDFSEGTVFGHHKERIEEKAQGQYHVVLMAENRYFATYTANGDATVSYEADGRGFKPQISYEDSEDLTRSIGYNSNANTRNYGNYKNGGQDARGY